MSGKTILKRTAVIVAGTFIVLFAVAFIVVHTSWFHRKVLSLVMEKGQAAIGGRLAVQNWDYRLYPLTFSLYGVVLHGTELADARPLLSVEKITVGLEYGPLLHGTIKLSELLVDRPAASVSVSRNGESNIPPRPPSNSNSTTTVWDLAVRHVRLSSGEIYYNDREQPVSADLHDLETQVHFDPAATKYSGSISYDRGRLQYAEYAPLPHALKAQFSATPAGASLPSCLLMVGSSRVSLHGEMVNYQQPVVNAGYQVMIHTPDFASLSPQVRPAGDVQVDGGMHYEAVPGKALLNTLSASGTIASSNLQAASPQAGVAVRDLKAQFSLGNGNLQVHGNAADFVGGKLDADVVMTHLDTKTEGTVRASLQQVSIEAARRSLKRKDIRQMPVTGTVDAGVHGNWAGSIKNIRLLGDANLRAAIWSTSPHPEATPIDGAVHLAYDGPRNELTLHQTVLHIPSTSVILEGRLGQHSDLQVHATAGDLHQLSQLLSSLQSAGTAAPSHTYDVSGTAKLDAVVQGSMHNPKISAQLEAQNLVVEGSRWRNARIVAAASPSEISIQQGSLVSAEQGQLKLNAHVQLHHWSYTISSLITGNLSASGMSVAELEHLANQHYPVTGTLSAQLQFSGTQLKPAGHGSIQLVRASAYQQPIQDLNLQFQAADETIHSTLNVTLPAGSATARVVFRPQTKAYTVDLHTSGMDLHKLQAVAARNLPITGTLTASGSGAGTIDHPQLDLTVAAERLDVHGTPLHNLKAQLQVQNQRATLALNSDVSQAFVRAHATIDLVDGYNTEAAIDTSKVPLDPFLALYAPSVPADFHGETELHATLSGPLKDQSRLQAHLTIPTLAGNYQNLQFANSGPIQANYANARIDLLPAEIHGTDTTLHFEGHVPTANNAPMSVSANGAVNLALLKMFSSGVKSSGELDLHVQAGGPIRNPEMRGTIQIKNGALSTSSAPVGVSKLNGTLDLTKDRVLISSLTGQMGGGEISAGGSIAYAPALQFNVALQAKSVRLLYPDGVRTVLGSNLTFTGNLQQASLQGRAVVDSLNFTPDFDLTSFAGQFGGPTIPPANPGFADNIKLAVAVQSAQNLSARSSQLSIEGTTNLQVIGTVADPVIIGRVDLTSGELFFMNNRYQLQRGIITFDDPNQTRPTLNVQVTTTIEQYNLTLTMMGPLDRLTTNYVSDPGLPTTDIISLVYRGQTVQQASAMGTSTDSLLASQAASRVSSGLQKLVGISSLQIDPLIGGNNTNPSARIAVQQRVTKNFLFTFSTDVTQPEADIVQGEYQLSKHWSVSVVRNQIGGVSVDGRFHTQF
jgi:translocation and assembly module TamB